MTEKPAVKSRKKTSPKAARPKKKSKKDPAVANDDADVEDDGPVVNAAVGPSALNVYSLGFEEADDGGDVKAGGGRKMMSQKERLDAKVN